MPIKTFQELVLEYHVIPAVAQALAASRLDNIPLLMNGATPAIAYPAWVAHQLFVSGWTTFETILYSEPTNCDVVHPPGPPYATVRAFVENSLLITNGARSWDNAADATREAFMRDLSMRVKSMLQTCYDQYHRTGKCTDDSTDDLTPIAPQTKLSLSARNKTKFGDVPSSSVLGRDNVINMFYKSATVYYKHISLASVVNQNANDDLTSGTLINDAGKSKRIDASPKRSINTWHMLVSKAKIWAKTLQFVCVDMLTPKGLPVFSLSHATRFLDWIDDRQEKWVNATKSLYRILNDNMIHMVDLVNSSAERTIGDELLKCLTMKESIVLAGPTAEDLRECGHTPATGKRDLREFIGGKKQLPPKQLPPKTTVTYKYPGLHTAPKGTKISGKEACKFFNDDRGCFKDTATCHNGHWCDVMIKDGNGEKACGQEHSREQHMATVGAPDHYNHPTW